MKHVQTIVLFCTKLLKTLNNTWCLDSRRINL